MTLFMGYFLHLESGINALCLWIKEINLQSSCAVKIYLSRIQCTYLCFSYGLDIIFIVDIFLFQTTINVPLSTMRHDETLFKNSHQFLPDRWLRGSNNKYRTDPFTFLSFGFVQGHA